MAEQNRGGAIPGRGGVEGTVAGIARVAFRAAPTGGSVEMNRLDGVEVECGEGGRDVPSSLCRARLHAVIYANAARRTAGLSGHEGRGCR
jgi:hypothetical protein